jgi:hypothetical protein
MLNKTAISFEIPFVVPDSEEWVLSGRTIMFHRVPQGCSINLCLGRTPQKVCLSCDLEIQPCCGH